MNRYSRRPREMNQLSLAEFATYYELKREMSKTDRDKDFDEDNVEESEDELGKG